VKAAPDGASNTDERLSRTPQTQEFMHMTSVSQTPTTSNVKHPTLADAATMLLPGLQQACTQLDLAIRVLSHFVPPPPEGAMSNAEATVRIRRALAAFGHPAVSR
jgi:hypothetical protein